MKIMNIFDFLLNKNAENAQDRFLNKLFYLYPQTCTFKAHEPNPSQNGQLFQNYEEYRLYFPVLMNWLKDSELFKDVITYKNCSSWRKKERTPYALGLNRCLNRYCILDSSFYDPDEEMLFSGFYRFRSAVIQMLRTLKKHIVHYPEPNNIKLNLNDDINHLILDNLKIIDEVYNKAKVSDDSLTDSVLENKSEILEENNSKLYAYLNPIQAL